MQRTGAMWFVLLASALMGAAHAQEESKPASDDSRPAAQHRNTSTQEGVPGASGERQIHSYRVEFAITELEGDKKINSRHYSMVQNSGTWNEIKIGTRVPVQTPQEPGGALDVGTSINCRLTEAGDDLALEVHSDFSNFSTPNEAQSSRPIVRQFRIGGSTLATSGKPVVIGALDDPNSNRQFQLQATATKLK